MNASSLEEHGSVARARLQLPMVVPLDMTEGAGASMPSTLVHGLAVRLSMRYNERMTLSLESAGVA